VTDTHQRALAQSVDGIDRVLADLVAGRDGLTVVDVGGGSGTRAVPLARQGCAVTVIDTSIDALAMLRRRAQEAGVAELIRGVQADADALEQVIAAGDADLVLCHHVLESVDDPETVIVALAKATRPGGLVSVLVAGRQAAVLAEAAAGRFSVAAAILADPDGRGGADRSVRRFDLGPLTGLLTGAGLELVATAGIGVVGSAATTAAHGHPQAEADLAALERSLSEHPVFQQIAADLHLLARRPA
jgi:S-adenosylmethionine-dependent methyltransferase